MRRILEVDGHAVIEQQPARSIPIGAREGDRSEVIIRGVIHLMLENGDECFACASCGNTFSKITSVISHRSHCRSQGRKVRSTRIASKRVTTSDSRIKPRMSEDLIKEVLRTIIEEGPGRNRHMRAASSLSRRGILTHKGHEWNASTVYNVWRTYRQQYDVMSRSVTDETTHMPPADQPVKFLDDTSVATAQMTLDELPVRAVDVSVDMLVDPLLTEPSTLEETIKDLDTLSERLLVDVYKLRQVLLVLRHEMATSRANAPSQEIIDKAARYDEIRRQLG